MGIITIKKLKNTIIKCGGNLAAAGRQGQFYVPINLGTDTGYAGIRYTSFGVPDRFELLWNGEVVADSKFVGDNINPGPPPSYSGILGPRTIAVFEYNGNGFTDTGETVTFTVTQDDIANGTTEPLAGEGIIYFNKNLSLPSIVTLRVTSVNGNNSQWSLLDVICPQVKIPTL